MTHIDSSKLPYIPRPPSLCLAEVVATIRSGLKGLSRLGRLIGIRPTCAPEGDCGTRRAFSA
jgi:hypothetical protein